MAHPTQPSLASRKRDATGCAGAPLHAAKLLISASSLPNRFSVTQVGNIFFHVSFSTLALRQNGYSRRGIPE
jgi:hypothetical protein